MHVAVLQRTFNYNGCLLADPDPQLSPERVKDFYSTAYPELTTAIVEAPIEINGRLEYSIRKAVETKG